MSHVINLALGVVVVPLGVIAYLAVSEGMLNKVGGRKQERIRPWVWVAPALLLLGGVLVYPLLDTVFLSLRNASSTHFVGLANYRDIFTEPTLLSVLKVNLLWIILFPAGSVVLGLVGAILMDKVRYERLAKAIITIPTAVSFVAASVVWELIYAYDPPGTPQTGALNALLKEVVPGFKPKAWLIDPAVNNYALIFVGIWIGTGLSTLILSAAVKAVPKELIEAARLDRASELRIVWSVVIPELVPALAVVTTVSVIASIRVFDIVYVMTGGNFGTNVISTQMYAAQFLDSDTGLATAIAVVLLVATAPVLLANRWFLRREA
jgi:alpha-glucoside transport system permease protein